MLSGITSTFRHKFSEIMTFEFVRRPVSQFSPEDFASSTVEDCELVSVLVITHRAHQIWRGRCDKCWRYLTATVGRCTDGDDERRRQCVCELLATSLMCLANISEFGVCRLQASRMRKRNVGIACVALPRTWNQADSGPFKLYI